MWTFTLVNLDIMGLPKAGVGHIRPPPLPFGGIDCIFKPTLHVSIDRDGEKETYREERETPRERDHKRDRGGRDRERREGDSPQEREEREGQRETEERAK